MKFKDLGKIKSFKRQLVFLLTVIWALPNFGQQDAQFTQYMHNKLYYNPGYAGSSGSICVLGMYRNQWLGATLDPSKEGANPSTPQTILLSVDAPIPILNGGLGLTVFNDKIGLNTSTTVKLGYAYQLYLNQGSLSIGLDAELFNSSMNLDHLVGSSQQTGNPLSPEEESIKDPVIDGKGKQSDFLFDLGFGLYYQIPGTMYLGLSFGRFLAAESDIFNYKNSRHLYLMGGYEFPFPYNPSFKFMPSAIIKTANFSSFQIDISCMAEYRRTYWVGATYRLQDAVALMGGIYWKDFKIGLSYDMTTSKMGYAKSGRSVGSLEVIVRYCFKVIKPPKFPTIHRNTRYLQ